jgi:hypothetical protein
MDRQLYGISTPQGREKYGLGSFFKSVAKAIIPKELDPVLKIAAPFLGPVYGPIAAIAGSARTGKINPLSLALTMAPYVQFGGAGQAGLGSFMPTGYGGAQYGAFGGDYVGLGTQGTSLSQLVTDKAKEFLSPATTPNQNYIKASFESMPPSGYTGGVDLAPSELTGGRTVADLQKGQLLQSAKELETGMGRSASDLIKTYGVQPGTWW